MSNSRGATANRYRRQGTLARTALRKCNELGAFLRASKLSRRKMGSTSYRMTRVGTVVDGSLLNFSIWGLVIIGPADGGGGDVMIWPLGIAAPPLP